MIKAKLLGAAAAVILMGMGVAGVCNAKTDSVKDYAVCTDSDLDSVISYQDQNGTVWCSEDNGETWMAESEYLKANPTPEIEWWTYDEYKVWMEQEEATMQEMADEKAIVQTSEGSFVWTQEMTDEMMEEHKKNLRDIKNGMLISRKVDGDDEGMVCFNSGNIVTKCD